MATAFAGGLQLEPRHSLPLIEDSSTFSRPRLLSVRGNRQVVRANYKLSKNDVNKLCVLKFFTIESKIEFEKEIQAYSTLIASGDTFYANPIGIAEWSIARYLKAIGKTIQPMEIGDQDRMIFVLVLQYVDLVVLSSIPIPVTVGKAAACLSSLSAMHALKMVHGDVTRDNILVSTAPGVSAIVWIDFSSSWTDASPNQIELEWNGAVEFFAHSVY
jgi:serine/threonine protein kinase